MRLFEILEHELPRICVIPRDARVQPTDANVELRIEADGRGGTAAERQLADLVEQELVDLRGASAGEVAKGETYHVTFRVRGAAAFARCAIAGINGTANEGNL